MALHLPAPVLADRLQHARLIRDIPLEMEVFSRRRHDRESVAVPAPRRALRGELLPLFTEGLAVEKELDRVAVGIDQHRDDLPLAAGPSPMREEMEHGRFGPQALIQVV